MILRSKTALVVVIPNCETFVFDEGTHKKHLPQKGIREKRTTTTQTKHTHHILGFSWWLSPWLDGPARCASSHPTQENLDRSFTAEAA